jgi:hypothetical protein
MKTNYVRTEQWYATTDLHGDAGAVVFVNVGGYFIDATGSARLGSFLLSAAGVDIVGAARKVVEAGKEVTRLNTQGSYGEYSNAVGELREMVDILAAELAKLDALEGGST